MQFTYSIGFLSLVLQVNAWGWQGHGMTGALAQTNLTAKAKEVVEKLLPEFTKGQLGNAASWADKVKRKPQYAWTKGLHYINPKDTPPTYCGYEKARDCPGTCISTGIANLSQVLMNGWKEVLHDVESGQLDYLTKLVSEQRLIAASQKGNRAQSEEHSFFTSTSTFISPEQADSDSSKRLQVRDRMARLERLNAVQEALMFLIHAIGDIHQPLHATGRDRGGNQAPVKYNGRSLNLHSVWDTKMLISRRQEFPNYIGHLKSRLVEEHISLTCEGEDLVDTVNQENKPQSKIEQIDIDSEDDAQEYQEVNGASQIKFRNRAREGTENNYSTELVRASKNTVCPDMWITESNLINCASVWKDFEYGMETGKEYFEQNKAVVELQIVRAGARIAAVLNQIFV